jgi:thiol-disulfide isomerase/thioredoxin
MTSLLAATLSVVAGATGPAFMTDWGAALERARREERPLFVHATASWCTPCRMLESEIYPVPAVAERLLSFVAVSVDVETKEGRELWMRWRLSGVPTLLFLDQRGREVEELRVAELPTPVDPAWFRARLDRAAIELGAPPVGWHTTVSAWPLVLSVVAAVALSTAVWWWSRRRA